MRPKSERQKLLSIIANLATLSKPMPSRKTLGEQLNWTPNQVTTSIEFLIKNGELTRGINEHGEYFTVWQNGRSTAPVESIRSRKIKEESIAQWTDALEYAQLSQDHREHPGVTLPEYKWTTRADRLEARLTAKDMI